MPLECPSLPTVLVIGVSEGPVCGVHDHGNRLSEALEGRDLTVVANWWQRTSGGRLRETLPEARRWSSQLKQSIRNLDPQAVLVHYSVFAFSHRGIPLFAIPVFRSLRGDDADMPILTLLHEYAYPWRPWGWRGTTWALTQRLVLWFLVTRSSALIVTTQQRSDWISSRRWLPRRRVFVAPVFSNLPPARAGCTSTPEGAQIGLFGYGHDAVALKTVLDALSELLLMTPATRLVLLGAPGADSPSGRLVYALAKQRGLENALNFTGVLPAQALSDALADCDVLLFADAEGPTSRKTTLAASLASGRPVVALDGSNTWDDLVLDRAIALVKPASLALAETISKLLAHPCDANELGTRGRAFADRQMSLDQASTIVLAAIREVVSKP
jgi:glycosyltransferase involved in cell wall biosynthesis